MGKAHGTGKDVFIGGIILQHQIRNTICHHADSPALLRLVHEVFMGELTLTQSSGGLLVVFFP